MHSRRIFGSAILLSLAALGLTACSSDPQERYVAELRSSNEVPANNSAAVGRVVLLVSRDASYAEYSVEQSGLSGGIRGGHFHRAAAGANGPIVLSFFFDSTTGAAINTPTPGTTDLELQGSIGRTINKTQLDAILADLRAGNLYANIHTPQFTGGEIRGQLIKQ
ncbi:MAG: CHRD domain-containing protein [Vicinamibacteria bacterium]|nr:CHRD domain-containing protein [Vicinamibacteria bacterium]